jgi:N-acetyl-anhydromuramyl-L-alanine amidase AmpD
LLGRDGTVKVIALGYANHAGTGGPHAGIPENQGNTYLYGIEAENNGVGERWPAKQLNAYYRLCAALLDYMNISDVERVFGHKEWTRRKIDPAGINMNEFRRRVKVALKAGPSVDTLSLSRLKPGKKNADVVKLKRALRKRGYYDAPKDTNFYGGVLRDAVKKFQKAQGWKGRDADGIPGAGTLNKLGFLSKP